jgi:hypothetical protein
VFRDVEKRLHPRQAVASLSLPLSSSTDPAQLHDASTTPTTSPDFNTFVSRFTASNTVGSISQPTGGTTGVGYIGPNFQYAIPEPSSLALLAVGGMVLIRRQRRQIG